MSKSHADRVLTCTRRWRYINDILEECNYRKGRTRLLGCTHMLVSTKLVSSLTHPNGPPVACIRSLTRLHDGSVGDKQELGDPLYYGITWFEASDTMRPVHSTCDPLTYYFTATNLSVRNQIHIMNTDIQILVIFHVGGPNKLIRSRDTLSPKNLLILTLTQTLLPPDSSSMSIPIVDFRSKRKRSQERISGLRKVGPRTYGRWSRRKLWEAPESIGRAGEEGDKHCTCSLGGSELCRCNDLGVGKGGIIVNKEVFLLFLFNSRSNLII